MYFKNIGIHKVVNEVCWFIKCNFVSLLSVFNTKCWLDSLILIIERHHDINSIMNMFTTTRVAPENKIFIYHKCIHNKNCVKTTVLSIVARGSAIDVSLR